MSIGVEDGAAEYMFTAPVGIGVGPQGEIVVLDARERNLRIYDRNGRFLRQMGRAGGGPGEFTSPHSLTVLDSVAYISDLNGRLTAFSLSGRYLWDRTMPRVSGGIAQRMSPLRHDYWLLMRAGLYSNLETDNRELLLLLRSGTGKIDTVSAHHPGSVLFERSDFPMLSPSGILLGAEVVWSIAGDSVLALVDAYKGTVRWMAVTPTGLRQTAERKIDLPVQRVSRADAERIRQQLQTRYSGWPNLKVFPPDQYGAATKALVDTHGRVWINRREGSERTTEWIIVSPNPQVAVRRIVTPEDFNLRLVHADRLYGTGKTKNGAPLVTVLRMN